VADGNGVSPLPVWRGDVGIGIVMWNNSVVQKCKNEKNDGSQSELESMEWNACYLICLCSGEKVIVNQVMTTFS